MDSPTLSLARELISRRSNTPNDADCQELLGKRLKKIGFNIDVLKYGDVTNSWARHGKQSPLICFAGHTDVVPSGPLDQWHSDPFVPTIRDGKLYGRGAADMKSSLAAFTVAVEEFIAAHPKYTGSIALLITSDEEGVAVDGTTRVVDQLKQRQEKIDYCIVGEPTSVNHIGDTIKNGRRGSLSATLRIKGIQGHVAYPHLAKNPVHAAAPALSELANIEWDRGNEFFPATTWQISNIHAGTGADNVIPGVLEIQFNFRYSTASTIESLKHKVESVLAKHQLNYEIKWVQSAKPFITKPGDLVNAITKAIKKVAHIDAELSTTGGTSDGRFIAEICPQVIEFGPLNATIHKLNECIDVSDLESLKEIYRLTLENILVKK